MLKSEDIINGLQSIVNDYSTVAILWHAVFYIMIAALIVKWEPSNKIFGLLISLPLLSVAILAWITGNPFNGTMFSTATILIFIFGLKADSQPINYSQLTFMISGIQ